MNILLYGKCSFDRIVICSAICNYPRNRNIRPLLNGSDGANLVQQSLTRLYRGWRSLYSCDSGVSIAEFKSSNNMNSSSTATRRELARDIIVLVWGRPLLLLSKGKLSQCLPINESRRGFFLHLYPAWRRGIFGRACDWTMYHAVTQECAEIGRREGCNVGAVLSIRLVGDRRLQESDQQKLFSTL